MFLAITIDAEEWRVHRVYGSLARPEVRCSIRGLEKLLDLFETYDVKATFFFTHYLASRATGLLRKVSRKHEIGSHGIADVDHTRVRFSRLSRLLFRSKSFLEKVTKDVVLGFRAPRHRINPLILALISSLGFRYDSSINPTWIPGRYNYLWYEPFIKTIKTEQGELIEVPISAHPLLRVPLMWVVLRNLPLEFIELLLHLLKKVGYAVLSIHPWDVELPSTRTAPFYYFRGTTSMIDKLSLLLEEFRPKAKFVTLSELLRKFGYRI